MRSITWHAAALNGDVVTQAHADYCAEHGHATYNLDNICPRCGDVTN